MPTCSDACCRRIAAPDRPRHAGHRAGRRARRKKPPVPGAWKSWEGTNHELSGTFAGRPKSPGDYVAAKRSRFLAWLTSAPSLPEIPPDTAKAAAKATLVGAGSVGQGVDRRKLQIHLAPTLMDTGKDKGAFAWWVARIRKRGCRGPTSRPAIQSLAGRCIPNPTLSLILGLFGWTLFLATPHWPPNLSASVRQTCLPKDRTAHRFQRVLP